MNSKVHDNPDDGDDQLRGCDRARARCPVAPDEHGGWNILRHADVRRVIHACPGAPLARLELRVVMEELLNATS